MKQIDRMRDLPAGGPDQPARMPFGNGRGRGLLRCLVAAALLAAPAAWGQAEPPDMSSALATLAALEEQGAETWTDDDADAFFTARAVIEAHLWQDPDGPDAQDWFSGVLVDDESGAAHGWLVHSPASLAAIAGRTESLAMDRALWFAGYVGLPWGIFMPDIDTCLAVKAFALQGATDLSAEDARMAKAIPAMAETERLRIWAMSEYRAAALTDGPLDEANEAAAGRALLTSQIISQMLTTGAADLATLQQGFFMHDVTGLPFTEAEIAEAFAGLNEDLRAEIEAARPFFADLEPLYALPPDEAIPQLCR